MNLKKCKKKSCEVNISDIEIPVVYNIIPCDNDSLYNEPTEPVICIQNPKVGFHIYGNVSEWLSEENTYIGGSWKDTTTTYFDSVQVSTIPTDFIGFRAVCSWEKYEEN